MSPCESICFCGVYPESDSPLSVIYLASQIVFR